MAFEGGPDAQNSTIEVPSFGLPSALWLYYPPNMNGELLWQSKCSNRWCYSPGCVPCAYNRSQKRVRDKIESDIRLVMEEYESEKQRGTEGIVHFKQTLVQRDLVRLLPGAVPGFALRNRRWGKSTLLRDSTQEIEFEVGWVTNMALLVRMSSTPKPREARIS